MREDDLDDIAALLGDPAIMAYYPAPRSRGEARAWIRWNLDNYERYGFGLWIVETHTSQFIGDCGLTMQEIGGRQDVEVGYHVRAACQGEGFATEAAAACRDHATSLGVRRLIAIIHPDNVPSQRVATNIGLTLEQTIQHRGRPTRIYSASLNKADPPRRC